VLVLCHPAPCSWRMVLAMCFTLELRGFFLVTCASHREHILWHAMHPCHTPLWGGVGGGAYKRKPKKTPLEVTSQKPTECFCRLGRPISSNELLHLPARTGLVPTLLVPETSIFTPGREVCWPLLLICHWSTLPVIAIS
jgi:hypothetical protein